MRNENLLYVSFAGYLREWLMHTFGNPVKFPSHSGENAVLKRFLVKLPAGARPHIVRGKNEVAVVAPAIAYKPYSLYNHLTEEGRRALQHSVKTLSIIDLWNSVSPHLLSESVRIGDAVECWCTQRGISVDNYSAVLQLFYRIRNDYRSSGVVVALRGQRNGHCKLNS